MVNIRLPTIALALLLLTTPVQASGLGNDKAAHITASAAAGIVLAEQTILQVETVATSAIQRRSHRRWQGVVRFAPS